ncbi:MAG TPA: TolC family protein, partial [Emticicia sp.]
ELDWITQMENDLVRAYNQYQTDKEILKLEEEYNKVAEENMQISLEKFRLGGSTILEINEAQRSLNTSLNRLTNARYNIKISELQLLRLSGELVK